MGSIIFSWFVGRSLEVRISRLMIKVLPFQLSSFPATKADECYDGYLVDMKLHFLTLTRG